VPKTKLGKWAGLFSAIFVVSLIIVIVFINVLHLRRGGRSVLTVLPVLIMMASGITAFITGLISLLKFQDRSLVVILAVHNIP
jgi:hypothetical protein